MKYIPLAFVSVVLALAGCAGDSSKKSADAASKREPVAVQDRCPPGYLLDETTRQCVEPQQTRRRGALRDTLGRSIDTSFPGMPLPTSGGLLGR